MFQIKHFVRMICCYPSIYAEIKSLHEEKLYKIPFSQQISYILNLAQCHRLQDAAKKIV